MTFVIDLVVVVVVIGLFGSVGPYELLLAVAIAAVAALVVRRRRARPYSRVSV